MRRIFITIIFSALLSNSFLNAAVADMTDESRRIYEKIGTPHFMSFPPGAPTENFESKLKRYKVPYNMMRDQVNGKTYIYWSAEYNEKVSQISNLELSAQNGGGILWMIFLKQGHYNENIQIWENNDNVWELFIKNNEIISYLHLNEGLDERLEFDTQSYIQKKYGMYTNYKIMFQYPEDGPEVNKILKQLRLPAQMARVQLPGKLKKGKNVFYYLVF